VIGLGRRFIESVRFPFREVSEASGVEKGPGRPPYWEMVFWWTRKPLISATQYGNLFLKALRRFLLASHNYPYFFFATLMPCQ